MSKPLRRKSRLRKWIFVLSIPVLLYVLGWGPVAAWRDYHPPKPKEKFWLYRVYEPVDFLHDRTPLHRPLHAWFRFCFERMYPPS